MRRVRAQQRQFWKTHLHPPPPPPHQDQMLPFSVLRSHDGKRSVICNLMSPPIFHIREILLIEHR